MKSVRLLLLIGTVSLLGGCSDIGYYLHCAKGHMQLMNSAQPIAGLIADPQTDPQLRIRLEKVSEMREFAVDELGLPDNDSYRRYADIGRPFVVWNLVATEEFSLQPKQWCFPFAGCLSYKGYFTLEQAEQQAARLREQQLDVDLYGVPAYSTLNWFADPILNTFIAAPEARLAGLLFHELAHQLIYVTDDTSFNEAFAMTVQIEGVRRWFEQHADPQDWQRDLLRQEQNSRFQDFLRTTREQLAGLYRQPLSESQMRTEKQHLIAAALERFEQFKADGWFGNGFDRWMSRGLNNARLAGIATYHDLIPEFQALLRSCDNDLQRFYSRVRELGELSQPERLARLKELSQPVVAERRES